MLKDDTEEDFAYLKHHLSEAQAPREWRMEHSTDFVKVFRKVNRNHHAHWSHIVLRCLAQLDHIPKHIVYKALAEVGLRAKWDHGLGDIEQLEHIKDKDLTYFRLRMDVPQHMQAREAVLVRKVLRDFPQINQTAIVHRSIGHPRIPENPRNSVRVETRMDGFIIEDDQSGKGTVLRWFLSTDLMGSLPNSMLNERFVRYQVTFI